MHDFHRQAAFYENKKAMDTIYNLLYIWDDIDANVVCGQIGHSITKVFHHCGMYIDTINTNKVQLQEVTTI